MMNITKIDPLESVENLYLRERAESARSCSSREFIAKIDGCEAGLLSYEDWSDHSLGFIYEIFVLPEYRGQRLGRELLSYAEELAKELHCTSIQLKPYAFDHTLDSEWLVSWYARHGYMQKTDDLAKMEKNLVGMRPNNSVERDCPSRQTKQLGVLLRPQSFHRPSGISDPIKLSTNWLVVLAEGLRVWANDKVAIFSVSAFAKIDLNNLLHHRQSVDRGGIAGA